MRRAWLAAALLALWGPAVGLAEEPTDPATGRRALAEELRLGGSLRGAYWSSSRSLDDGEHFWGTALWLKAAPRLGPAASLVVEGWVRNQELFREDATDGELREGYVETALGRLDLRVGKQIIAWGRADRINPTDNLTPRDFTLLVPEDEEQRLGAVAAKATYYLGSLALTGIWLPHFEPHTIPLERERGVTVRQRLPDGVQGQWAARLEQTGGAVDWSVSYFDGFDLVPDLAIDRVLPDRLELRLRHRRIRVIGADAASTVGRYGLRGEAAFTFTRDPRGTRPDVKNPFFFVVVGGDRTVLEHLNVNLQYLFRLSGRHESPVEIPDPLQRSVATQHALIANELDRVQHGAALRIANKWLNETLEAELAAVVLFTRSDFVVRPKVTYAVTDRWKAIVGADIFRGPRPSFLGRLRDNSTAYAELRWSF